MPDSVDSVLFVCMQNVCRSIAAEAVFRYLAENTALAVEIDSAGVHALPGHLPDPKMCVVAARRGYNLSKLRSRPFTSADARFDLILAVDRNSLSSVKAQAPDARSSLLMPYSRAFIHREVLFSDERRGYESMLDCIEDACLGVLRTLPTRG